MRSTALWLLLAALATAPIAAQGEARTQPASHMAVAAAYLDAMETADLDKAESLFASESSIFEGGGNEGTWKHYREHHIGPELAEFRSFKTTRGKAEEVVSADGSMAMVAWPIDYHIELRDGRTADSQSTVTFVLVRQGDTYRIRHLHWSSRKKKS